MSLFVDPSRAKQYECVICLEIYKEPVQIGCQEHIFCKRCVDKLILEEGRSFHCPLCRIKCKSKTVTRVKFIDRQINDLLVKCPNATEKEECIAEENDNKPALRRSIRLKNKGNTNNKHCGQKRKRLFDDEEQLNSNKRRKLDEICEWEGSYCDLNNHIKECPLQLISCEYCDDRMLQRELEEHHDECPSFPMKCMRCEETEICRNKMTLHITRRCPMTLVNCSKCKEKIQRCKEKIHLKNECAESLINCTFHAFGCVDKLKRKNEKRHIMNAAFTHNHLVQIANHQLKLVDTVNALKNENKALNTRINALEKKVKKALKRSNALENKQERIEKEQNKSNREIKRIIEVETGAINGAIATLPRHFPVYKLVYVDPAGTLFRYKNETNMVQRL